MQQSGEGIEKIKQLHKKFQTLTIESLLLMDVTWKQEILLTDRDKFLNLDTKYFYQAQFKQAISIEIKLS